MKINKLSKKTIDEACNLVLKTFDDAKPEDYDYPPKWIKISLLSEDKQKKFGSIINKYWVALENQKVIGIIGMYHDLDGRKDKNWVGWFCVDPKSRGKQIGKELLKKAINSAKEEGRKYLELYTSTNPKEKIAHNLYRTMGFKITKREKGAYGKEDKLFFQLQLKD